MSLIHELVRLAPDGTHTLIAWLDPRPPHCNRGRFRAGVEIVVEADAVTGRETQAAAGGRTFQISSADWWPRYYFDYTTAKRELAAWLTAHGVDLGGTVWQVAFYENEKRCVVATEGGRP